MRGVIRSLYRGITWIALASITLATVFTNQTPITHAEGSTLELARDTVGSFIPDATNIYHEIYFVLPVSSQQLSPTDYLTINFANYNLVNISSIGIYGVYGTPTVTLSGKEVRITNIAILPGTGVTISGINATNPPTNVSNQVTVSLREGSATGTVRNQAILLPTDSRSIVNVSATIQSPLAAIIISGVTSPLAFVTLTENNTVLATTVASPTGFFNFNLTGIDTGAHAFAITGTDTSNRSTAPTTLNVFLLPNTLSSATGIILSSSMGISSATIAAGDALTFNGAARPNSQINIFVEAPLRSYVANTGSNGEWTYTMTSSETGALTPGIYQVYSVVQDDLGNQSVVSPTLNFTVGSPTDPDNPPPACDIRHGDLNCNGVTNLVDFSILLFHWNTNHLVADINTDGAVNLVDFSIMMFYYSG